MKSEDAMLAAIAGFVDTSSFVAMFGFFTAQITGNIGYIRSTQRRSYHRTNHGKKENVNAHH